LTNRGYFANNILVATDENIQLDAEDENCSILVGKVHLPDKPCYLEIIDGQHRLFGYSGLRDLQDNCLSVTVISNLSSIERAKLFVLVNREQTKVPQYLLWDLYSQIEPNRLRGKISIFVQQLNGNGPLKDLIKLPRARSISAFLSFANICQSFYKRTGLYNRYGGNSSFIHVVNSLFSVIREDRDLGEDWLRSVEQKSKSGFLCTNNALSIQIYLLAKILRKRDEQNIAFPTSTQIEDWKLYLRNRILDPIRQFLQGNIDPNNQEDLYGVLRKRTSNEAQRGEAANNIFNQIDFT